MTIISHNTPAQFPALAVHPKWCTEDHREIEPGDTTFMERCSSASADVHDIADREVGTFLMQDVGHGDPQIAVIASTSVGSTMTLDQGEALAWQMLDLIAKARKTETVDPVAEYVAEAEALEALPCRMVPRSRRPKGDQGSARPFGLFLVVALLAAVLGAHVTVTAGTPGVPGLLLLAVSVGCTAAAVTVANARDRASLVARRLVAVAR